MPHSSSLSSRARPPTAGLVGFCAGPAKKLENFVIEIVRRIEGEPGFKELPRRWVVERTFD
jgi:hypothetical protein